MTEFVADANRSTEYHTIGNVPATADPGRRLLARLVDSVIIFAVCSVLAVLMLGIPILLGTEQSVGPLIFLILFIVGFTIAYEVVCIARDGQTPGKRMMGLRVVAVGTTNQNPSAGSAFLRFLVPNLAAIVPFGAWVTYASILWGEQGRGWHDMVAKTRVVPVDRSQNA